MPRLYNSILKGLGRAEREQYPVAIDRGDETWANWASGYVVGVGKHWVVLQSLAERVNRPRFGAASF